MMGARGEEEERNQREGIKIRMKSIGIEGDRRGRGQYGECKKGSVEGGGIGVGGGGIGKE